VVGTLSDPKYMSGIADGSSAGTQASFIWSTLSASNSKNEPRNFKFTIPAGRYPFVRNAVSSGASWGIIVYGILRNI
jgi:hypothetical protein